jgi:transposase
MDNATHMGLDVHKDTIAVAILRPGKHEPDERTIPNTAEALRALVQRRHSSHRLLACYEAGPTGYDTYRLLSSLGVPCDIIAPTLIPRRVGRRGKTDRIDARHLARLHRAGELTPIRLPTPEEEAIRDLVRVREDIKDDRRRTMHRMKSFLLPQGRRYPGKAKGWTDKYDKWVHARRPARQSAEWPHSGGRPPLDARRLELRAIDAEISKASGRPPLEAAVARLRCFRGIDSLSAVTMAAEVCDFHRFATATQFMAFTGLVPSEHSSGPTEHRGSITKTGNAHLRRVLVEAAWSYRHRPAVGIELRRRSEASLPRSWPTPGPPSADSVPGSASWPPAGRAASPWWPWPWELAGFVWGMMTDRLAVA